MKTLLILLIAIYLLIRGVMLYFSYTGKKTEEKEKLALKYFTPEEIEKGAEYARKGFGIGLFQRAVEFLFPFVFFFTGFSSMLSASLKFPAFFGSETLRVILFVAVYYAISFAVMLPFRYYFGFVLEHKFGFSNMKPKEWLAFNLKQLAVSLAFTCIIAAAAYFVFRRSGPDNLIIWLIPVVMLFFELFFTFLYPYIILPIFYKKSAFEDERYAKPIREVAEKAGVHVGKIFQVNESKYSKHTNAFFTGFGPEKSIYIYDTLVKTNTPEQVTSVVAHEIGHWKHNHVLKGIALGFAGSILMTGVVYYTFNACFPGNLIVLSDPAGLPFIAIILTVYSFFLAPVENLISRMFEVTADTYEINMGGHPEIYIKSMVQLAKDNRSFLYPHPWVVFWFASHPSILERVKMGEEFKR
jgi:STE24 endopeptidase